MTVCCRELCQIAVSYNSTFQITISVCIICKSRILHHETCNIETSFFQSGRESSSIVQFARWLMFHLHVRNLQFSKFHESNFLFCNLKCSNMLSCNLQNSNVLLCHLQHSNFSLCNLQDRNLVLQANGLLSYNLQDRIFLLHKFYNSKFLSCNLLDGSIVSCLQQDKVSSCGIFQIRISCRAICKIGTSALLIARQRFAIAQFAR